MSEIKSLKKLRKQNEVLREKIQAEGELVRLEQERIRLGEQNRKLIRQLKRSPTEKAVRGVLNSAGKGLFIAGKSVGKGLIRYGKFLDEKENEHKKKVRVKKKPIKRRKYKKPIRRRKRR